jgi:WD40 repeat protein
VALLTEVDDATISSSITLAAMPSTSPGPADTSTTTTTTTTTTAAADFSTILPGAPTESLQAVTSFVYRFKRYVAYISAAQLLILSAPHVLAQAIAFPHPLVAVVADPKTGKLIVAGQTQVWILEAIAEGWTRVWWEKSLLLKREDEEDEAHAVCWSNEGEALVGGSASLTLFSTLPSSRSSSPRTSAIDGETVEERRMLWSKPVASPIRQVDVSPSSTLIASCSRYDRLVKIWRRLSFEEGLFDYTYLPHPASVTHLRWHPPTDREEGRRISGISGRHEDDPEVLYTIASDGVLRVWRAGGLHDLDILVLHASVDLVAAIPDSPSLTANSQTPAAVPARYALVLPASQFSAAVNFTIGLSQGGKTSHSKELLKEMISKDLDVIVSFDAHGRMSAWGLQSIGHQRRPDTPTNTQPFHIAHAEGLSLKLPKSCPALMTGWFEDDQFHLLMHAFAEGGSVTWWQGNVETFFSPSAPGCDRLSLASSWRGQNLSEWSGTSDEVQNGFLSNIDDDKIIHAVAVPVPSKSEQKCVVTVSQRGVVNQRSYSSPKHTTLETGIEDADMLAASADVAALASEDHSLLTLLDLRDGYVEHRQHFPAKVSHLSCWTSRSGQHFIATAYGVFIDILGRGRYQEGQTWHTLKRVSLGGIGLNVRGLAWNSDGFVGIAAGEGVYVLGPNVNMYQLQDDLRESISHADDINDHAGPIGLLRVAELMTAPLPIWHPSILTDHLYQGRHYLAASLLKKLAYKLKFWGPGEPLSPTLDEEADQLSREPQTDAVWIDEDSVNDLTDQLEEKQLPSLSRADQQRLKNVVNAMAYLREHVRGLDVNALRYLFNWKLQLVEYSSQSAQPNGSALPNGITSPPHDEFVPEMQWREIAFAYHSTTQQPLLDILILHHDNKLTWNDARRLGITSWISDRDALVHVFEQLAQTAYRSSQPPDPVNASIYYLALHKKQTLLALWRIATWHREQRTTTNFLKRDFHHADARTAAKKNAYALLGKRRFHYAAAFFLLADDPADACNVLAGQCEDVHFAIAVARLYCGDGHPVLHDLLTARILPDALLHADRWLTSWCHAVLRDPPRAARVLVQPLARPRPWLRDHPSTLVLYRLLRTASSSSSPSSVHEYDAVRRAARLLRRQGSVLGAVALLQTWSFIPPKKPSTSTSTSSSSALDPPAPNGIASPAPAEEAPSHPPSALDGFAPPADPASSREAQAALLLAKIRAKTGPVAASSGSPSAVIAEGAGGGKMAPTPTPNKATPTQFSEPDANSLLDSFGF